MDSSAILNNLESSLSKVQKCISDEVYSEIQQQMQSLKNQIESNQNLMFLARQQMEEIWSQNSENEMLLQSILNSSDEAIVAFDSAGKIISINQIAQKLLCIEKNKNQELFILDFLSSGDLHEIISSALEVFKGEQSFVFDSSQVSKNRFIFDKRKDGTLILKSNPSSELVHIHYLLTKIETKNSIVFCLFFRDITVSLNKQSELDAVRTQAVASSKMAALGEMAGGIAHEINSPLNVFTISAGVLRDMAKQETIDREVLVKVSDRIESTALRVAKVVQSLRSISRDDTDQDCEQVNLVEVVQDALNLCAQKLKYDGVEVKLAAFDQAPSVLARSVGLTQVLLNLIGNSQDAIRTLDNKWIKIDYAVSEGFLTLRITDSGPGIPQLVAEKIMNPFFTTKEVGKGTGLGLSISKSLIESFGGSFLYNSECENTQFLVRLKVGASSEENSIG